MTSRTWTLIGASVVAAGVLMLGMAYATSGVVHAANNGQIPCDATATRIPGNGQIQAFQRLPECTPTTQRKLKTHTPTATPTESPKTTTPVPTNTQPAPTNTPKAASEGVAVKPPNTGSGNGGSGDMTLWLLALGVVAVGAGGGAILVGVRRRS